MTCKYSLVIEGASAGYSAYVPELPTILVTGRSVDEIIGPRGWADSRTASDAAGHYRSRYEELQHQSVRPEFFFNLSTSSGWIRTPDCRARWTKSQALSYWCISVV